MRKGRAITVLEIALGLLPASVVLLPLLMAGATGTAVAVVVILADGSRPFSTRLTMALPSAGIILWVLCATVGMLALWVAVLSRQEVDHRPRARAVLITSLVCGSVAAILWLYDMGRTTHDLKTWAVWIGFLGGPLIVSARHLFVLVRDWRSQSRDPVDPPPKTATGG
jgi:hypothetical protein